MIKIATLADKRAVEAEMPWQDRWRARSLYEQLAETAERFPDRPALTLPAALGAARQGGDAELGGAAGAR